MKNTQETDIVHILGINDKFSKGKFLKRLIITGLILILAVITGFIVKGSEKSGRVHYMTKSAFQGNLTIKVSATGNIVPTNKVEVGSELSGIIRTVEVDYNDRVKKGQVMARLDSSRLEAEVMKSKAALSSAKAKLLSVQSNLWKTHRKFLRLKQTWEKTHHKIPSKDEMDQAKASFESALANEASAKALIMESEAILKANLTDMSKTIIYSPINGIVLTRNVEPGQTVAASLQAPILFTLAQDLSSMELNVDVDEADVGHIHPGQDVVFTVDAYPSRSFYGKVIKIYYGSKTTNGVVTYQTIINVNNSDLSLLPGMTASADITIKKFQNILLIPNEALRFSPPEKKESSSGTGFMSKLLPRRHSVSLKKKRKRNPDTGTKQVWVQRNGRLVSIVITVGDTDGNVTEVIKGNIKPGMKLVTNIVN